MFLVHLKEFFMDFSIFLYAASYSFSHFLEQHQRQLSGADEDPACAQEGFCPLAVPAARNWACL